MRDDESKSWKVDLLTCSSLLIYLEVNDQSHSAALHESVAADWHGHQLMVQQRGPTSSARTTTWKRNKRTVCSRLLVQCAKSAQCPPLNRCSHCLGTKHAISAGWKLKHGFHPTQRSARNVRKKVRKERKKVRKKVRYERSWRSIRCVRCVGW